MDDVINTHTFCFNPQDNSGESVILTTKFIPNGNTGELDVSQELSLQSYNNSASFYLVGSPLTPANLRTLAEELARAATKARNKFNKK